MRYNLYRCAQLNVTAKPGVSSLQAMKALEEVFAATMPARMGYDYLGMSVGKKSATRRAASIDLWAFLTVSIFNPCRSVRELGVADQRLARHPDRSIWCVVSLVRERTGK